MGSTKKSGNSGAFSVVSPFTGEQLFCIASDQMGWEHVSISLYVNRPPTWDEMAFVKGLFWGEEDLVVQYHPTRENYVNFHNHVLHLWRKAGTNGFCETPPLELV